jgi:hypothetical protein
MTTTLDGMYAAAAWFRYGHGKTPPDSLLDQFMSSPEVAERHEIRVAAPAALTFAAAIAFDLEDSRVVRVIFAIRTVPARWSKQRPIRNRPRGLLAHTRALGWGSWPMCRTGRS